MFYVYNKPAKNRVPKGAIVQIVFGGIIALLIMLCLIITKLTTDEQLVSVTIAYSILLTPGAFLLLFFGIRRTIKSAKAVVTKDFMNPPVFNPADPLFTTTCASCGTTFDYQKSNLRYSKYFPYGYVICPVCGRPTPHDAFLNTYYTGNDPMYTKLAPNPQYQCYTQQNFNQPPYPQQNYPQYNFNQQPYNNNDSK